MLLFSGGRRDRGHHDPNRVVRAIDERDRPTIRDTDSSSGRARRLDRDGAPRLLRYARHGGESHYQAGLPLSRYDAGISRGRHPHASGVLRPAPMPQQWQRLQQSILLPSGSAIYSKNPPRNSHALEMCERFPVAFLVPRGRVQNYTGRPAAERRATIP